MSNTTGGASGAWVFGYGSLVSVASAAATLGQSLHPPRPVFVDGVQRSWSILQDNARDGRYACLKCGGLPRWTLSVGIAEEAGASCAGVLVWVPEHSWPDLDERERGYERRRLLGHRLSDAPDEPAWSYFGPVQPSYPEGTVLPTAYHDVVDEAFAGLGGAYAASYRREPLPDVPLADTQLVAFADRPAARGLPACTCWTP